MLNTLVPPPPQVFSDQLPILGSGMNSGYILPTSPNNVFDIGDERLMSHYSINGSNLILPTSPNIFLHCEDNLICPTDERLMSHYPMNGSNLVLPTSPNNFLNGEDDEIRRPNKRLMSHYPDNGSNFKLPTSPNNFFSGMDNPACPPTVNNYRTDGSSLVLLPTSPNTILNSPTGEILTNHYSSDGSSVVLPTSPNSFLISQDNPNCPTGERLKSHYPTYRSTPTSPNNFLGGKEDNRFCPSDERLINHYLKQKMLGNEDQVDQIPEVDILSREPWDLLPITVDDEQCYKEAYYFCRRRSYFKSKDRYKRTTGDGYWKPTGKPRHIKNGANGEVIGSKRCLVFHFGRSVGQSTGYTMHEYSAAAASSSQPVVDLVLCKVMKKSNKTKAATKRKAKTVLVSQPPSDENVNTITTAPLQTAEEPPAICQMDSNFGNQDTITPTSQSPSTQNDGGIEDFSEIELEIDGEIFRLPGVDFKFDFEPWDKLQQQQQPPPLEAEYFPGMVQQSG